MDSVKKRVNLYKTKIQPQSPQEEEDQLDNINLLNTIKVPKNLAQLTKNLPKSNYMSTREPKLMSDVHT